MMEVKKLTKEDCGRQATLDDMKERLVLMLSALAKFCDENGIRYYLSGGTLLGAVRHKGFIPWDDDIDINVPRPDCEKLQSLSGGMIDGKYYLQRPDPFAIAHSEAWRLYDFSMVIENSLGRSSKKPFYTPIFIDIFPIEGLPSDDEELRKHFKKIKRVRFFLLCGIFNAWKGTTFVRKVAHLVFRPFSKLVGIDTLYNKIQDLGKKYPFDECDHIGVVTAPVHTVEERVLKEEYIPQVDVAFEGRTFKGPANYDTYLTQLYGKDYMQIPPESKRHSHHGFTLYFNKNEG